MSETRLPISQQVQWKKGQQRKQRNNIKTSQDCSDV